VLSKAAVAKRIVPSPRVKELMLKKKNSTPGQLIPSENQPTVN
jgi:hypothetical protein